MGNLSERDLLHDGRYAWPDGYTMAGVLLVAYDHHLEHLAPSKPACANMGWMCKASIWINLDYVHEVVIK